MAEPSVTPPTEYYHLAISYRPAPHAELHQAEIARFTDPDLGPVIAYDAAQDPDACRVILGALLEVADAAQSEAARHDSIPPSPAAFSADLEPRLFTGQQSNTSVMLGEVAMIKLFRRLELGHNLDIEVHAALNAAGVSDVAGLFGWIEGSWVSRRVAAGRRSRHGGGEAGWRRRRLGAGPGFTSSGKRLDNDQLRMCVRRRG